jgi:hypothetical protein
MIKAHPICKHIAKAPQANAKANFCDKREQRQTRLIFAERSKNQRS